MNRNKVEFGFSNVHIAIELDDGGWGVPRHLPGAVLFAPESEGEAYNFWADDGAYYSEVADNGFVGDWSVALLPDWFLGDVLGYKRAPDGALVGIRGAVKRRFCMIFEGKGDKNRTRFVYVGCSAGKPTEEFKTVEEEKEVRVQTMTLSVTGDNATGTLTLKYAEGDEGYESILTAIPAFTGYTPIVSVYNRVTANTAAFSKGTPADVVIDATSTDQDTLVTGVTIDTKPVTSTNLTIAGSDVTVKQAALTPLSVGTHSMVVTFDKGNTVNVTLTVTE